MVKRAVQTRSNSHRPAVNLRTERQKRQPAPAAGAQPPAALVCSPAPRQSAGLSPPQARLSASTSSADRRNSPAARTSSM